MYLLLSTLSIQAEPVTRASALQIAQENNPEIVAAHAAWKAEQARALQTWALPPPELELEYEGLPGAFDLGQYEQRTIGFSQRMKFPVKWWQRHQAANRLADAVRLSVYETTRLNITRDVQIAYDRVLADQQILLLTKKHVQLARDFLERAQKRFDAGDVPRLDIMRAEVTLARLENKLMAAQNAVFMSRGKVNVLMGQMPDVSLTLADSLNYQPAAFDLDSLYAQALRQRSDFRATTRVLESAKATRTASLASFVPDLSLSIAQETTIIPAGRLKSWRTGFVLQLPLWAIFEER
ncbi:MAG: TolC family protein, partial [Candidatus Latescibacteria bacterium]|nr:TolC family protein [Candidatus Latescibacterota bacterium]